MIKTYYYKWWLYTPNGIKLSDIPEGTTVNVRRQIFRLGLFYKFIAMNKNIHLQHRHRMKFGEMIWVKVFRNWHINLIKEGWIFSVQTKNGSMLYCADHIHKSVISWNIVCSVSMFEILTTLMELFTCSGIWLDMLIYSTPLSFLLLLIGCLRHPQAFAIICF